MYESWFGLSKRPFNAPPQTADYFAEQGIETAREAVIRCIERSAGPGVVIGDGPAGKRYRRMARDLGIDDRTHFTGRPLPEQLPGLLASLDVAVFQGQFRSIRLY